MGMFPNILQRIPFKKHKKKDVAEKGQEKNEECNIEKKEEAKVENEVPVISDEAPKVEVQQQ